MESFDFGAFYDKRLLIFLEIEPQSNKYRQIILTPEEFKNTSLTLGKVVEQKGTSSVVELEESDEIYNLPDLKAHK